MCFAGNPRPVKERGERNIPTYRAKGIAEHERKRRIEAELLVLSETLGDQGYTEDKIAEKVREVRRALEAQSAAAELPARSF